MHTGDNLQGCKKRLVHRQSHAQAGHEDSLTVICLSVNTRRRKSNPNQTVMWLVVHYNVMWACSLENACHTWAPYRRVHDEALYTNPPLHLTFTIPVFCGVKQRAKQTSWSMEAPQFGCVLCASALQRSGRLATKPNRPIAVHAFSAVQSHCGAVPQYMYRTAGQFSSNASSFLTTEEGWWLTTTVLVSQTCPDMVSGEFSATRSQWDGTIIIIIIITRLMTHVKVIHRVKNRKCGWSRISEGKIGCQVQSLPVVWKLQDRRSETMSETM